MDGVGVSASRRWDGGGGSLIMYIVSKKRKKRKNFGCTLYTRPCSSPQCLVLDMCHISVFMTQGGCYREGWWCVMRWRGVMMVGCDEHHSDAYRCNGYGLKQPAAISPAGIPCGWRGLGDQSCQRSHMFGSRAAPIAAEPRQLQPAEPAVSSSPSMDPKAGRLVGDCLCVNSMMGQHMGKFK